MPKILRFNICNEISSKLVDFHNKNKETEHKQYKEEWNKFVEENSELISQQERNLVNIGFRGDIEQKLFTSVKYYISKKNEEKTEPKERRTYVHICKKILLSMDEHIIENKNEEGYTPANGFSKFSQIYELELNIEKERLRITSELSIKDIELKIKKTYKNRYFILIK